MCGFYFDDLNSSNCYFQILWIYCIHLFCYCWCIHVLSDGISMAEASRSWAETPLACVLVKRQLSCLPVGLMNAISRRSETERVGPVFAPVAQRAWCQRWQYCCNSLGGGDGVILCPVVASCSNSERETDLWPTRPWLLWPGSSTAEPDTSSRETWRLWPRSCGPALGYLSLSII